MIVVGFSSCGTRDLVGMGRIFCLKDTPIHAHLECTWTKGEGSSNHGIQIVCTLRRTKVYLIKTLVR